MTHRFLSAAAVLLFCASQPSAADPGADMDRIQGSWEITSLIDDGDLVPISVVKDRMIQNAQLTIDRNLVRFTRPLTGKEAALPFVLDSTASPKTMDIAGTENTGSKGIYLLDGETLIICLGGKSSATRPVGFGAEKGSQDVLMTLRKARQANPTPVEVPPIKVTTPPPTAPKPVTDEGARNILAGTWGSQDSKRVEMITFNLDGTFSTTTRWKGGFKKIFESDIRSSGTWKVEQGTLILKITASTDRKEMGQVYSYRIRSISTNEVIYIDQNGYTRIEWRAR